MSFFFLCVYFRNICSLLLRHLKERHLWELFGYRDKVCYQQPHAVLTLCHCLLKCSSCFAAATFFSIRLTYRKVLSLPTPHLFPSFPVIFLCALGVMPGDCIPVNGAFTRSTMNSRLGERYRKALVEWHQSQGRLRRWRLSRWLGVATQSFQRLPRGFV